MIQTAGMSGNACASRTFPAVATPEIHGAGPHRVAWGETNLQQDRRYVATPREESLGNGWRQDLRGAQPKPIIAAREQRLVARECRGPRRTQPASSDRSFERALRQLPKVSTKWREMKPRASLFKDARLPDPWRFRSRTPGPNYPRRLLPNPRRSPPEPGRNPLPLEVA